MPFLHLNFDYWNYITIYGGSNLQKNWWVFAITRLIWYVYVVWYRHEKELDILELVLS
jgi:hypothetical protein